MECNYYQIVISVISNEVVKNLTNNSREKWPKTG